MYSINIVCYLFPIHKQKYIKMLSICHRECVKGSSLVLESFSESILF